MPDTSVVLLHAAGLHARPAVTLTKLAKTFGARIHIAANPDGPWVDAKSIVKVMQMKTPAQTTLHLRAEGADAHAALTALVTLVNADFTGGPE
jgi:phosphocarrier protein HPr